MWVIHYLMHILPNIYDTFVTLPTFFIKFMAFFEITPTFVNKNGGLDL